jgi:hypothetical protein
MSKKQKKSANLDVDDDPNTKRTLLQRHTASHIAAKCTTRGITLENHAPNFYACLAHSLKDCHIDPLGTDQWVLPLSLGTMLAALYVRDWAVIFVLFGIYYLLQYAVFFFARLLTRRTTASITARHDISIVLLTDPLVFLLFLFAAWYTIDYSVIGYGVHGPAPWWQSALVLLAVIPTGIGRALVYWVSLAILFIVIWGTYFISVFTTHSHHRQDYALWLSLRATGFVLFFFVVFIRPMGDHFLQNALFAQFLLLFFVSLIQFIAVE